MREHKMEHTPYSSHPLARSFPPLSAEMAAVIARSSASVVASSRPARKQVQAQAALKPSVKAAPAVSTAAANQMMVWQPMNNKWVHHKAAGGLIQRGGLRPPPWAAPCPASLPAAACFFDEPQSQLLGPLAGQRVPAFLAPLRPAALRLCR